MEKFLERFNESTLRLKPGESRIVYDSRNDKTTAVVRTNRENMVKDIHETMKEALKKAGIEARD